MIHRIPNPTQPRQAGSGDLVATAVMGRLRGQWSQRDFRPPTTPAVGRHVVAISQARAWDANSAAQTLRIDPMFAVQVLRAANAITRTRSLGRAAQILGEEGMRRELLKFAASLKVLDDSPVTDAVSTIHRAGWRRAEAVRAVCRYTTLDTELAATGALLADFGLVAGLVAGAETPKGFTPPSLNELWEPVQRGHESIGWFLADAWGLPEELGLVIGNHHGLTVGGTVHPVLCAIALADSILADLGLELRVQGVPNPTVSPNQRLVALRAVGMSRKQYKLARLHARSRLMS